MLLAASLALCAAGSARADEPPASRAPLLEPTPPPTASSQPLVAPIEEPPWSPSSPDWGAPRKDAAPQPPDLDPLVPTAFALLGVGAIGAGIGAGAFASLGTGNGQGGISRKLRADRGAAAAGITAGGTLMLMSAPLFAVHALTWPSRTPRRSEGAMVTGVALTALGTASLAAAFTDGVVSHGRGAAAIGGLVAAGSTSLLVGVPLWASGSRRIDVEDETVKSPVRMSVGMTLISTGITAVAVGGGLVASGFSEKDKSSRQIFQILGGFVAIPGAALCLIGGPIYASGAAARTPRGREAVRLPVPEILIGGPQATLRWRF